MTETAGGTAAPNGGPDTVEEMPLFRLVPRRDAAAPKPQSRRERLRSFVLRIDVSWTAFFFLFLVCVAITTVSISYTRMFDSPRAVWHAVHNSRLTLYRKLLDLEIENAHSIATTLMAANVRKPLPMESEKTLSVVCSTFVTLDTEVRLRAVLAVSAAQKETVVCIRGGLSNHSPRTLTGYISHNSIVEGTYYVDNVTFEYARPLEMADVWAPSVQNISGSLSASLLSREGFRQSKLYYQGLINSVDPRTLWFYFAKAPHMFYYNVPITMVARGLNLSATDTIDDFAQVRIDGSALLPLAESFKTRSGRVILLVNSSLTSSDPFIFSNNLGEQSVNDTKIYSANAAGPLSYLKVSEVRDPLMRTALKHVKLAPLQAQGYAHTVEFVYRGAPAFATAFTFTSKRGLILPVVLVSGQRAHSPPYVRVSNVYIGIIAAVVLILTALFWGFVHVSFSRPLEAMTQRMLGNLNTGHRTLFYPAGGTVCVQLSEVQQLIDAHDATVRQLRIIDGFIPAELRRHIRRSTETRGNAAAAAAAAQNDNAGASPSHACAADAAEVSEEELVRQLLTVVYITIHPPAPQRAANAVQDIAVTVPQALSPKPYQGQRLVAAVDAAAHTVPLVNSGPFASAAAVGDFLTKVEELCEANHGSLHRFAPDSCVAHFGSFTRAHQVRKAARASPPPTAACPAATSILSMSDETRDVIATQACAAADARNALRFALALQQWSQEHLADPSPRVTVLVDTSTFTCGRHRPRGSEQTLSVAFGRDVQRKLGHIPLKIGVGVAMTEETATLLRAEHQRGDVVGGVRQIPVESLHVGRPGLNADVVILYEALPGAAEGDEVWQRYCWCCFRGFTLMVRGRYAAALSAFKAIADISDLEPGLMPFSLRREAARSDAVGGAVSVQVQRLMRECVKRVARGDARPFCRERCDPLGIDAVLQGVSTITELSSSRTSRSAAATQSESAPRHQRPPRAAAALPFYPEAKPRHVMEYSTRGERIRTVVAGTPDWLQDNYKMCWQVAPKSPNIPAHGAWRKFQICLGAGGALAVVDVLPLREVPRPVANAIRDAPLGPMSDALRSATPVFGLTPQQKAAARAVFKQQCSLRHPNLLVPLSYCTAVEGGVAVLFEYFTGGTLRQVIRRYEHLKPVTIARFMHGVLSGLLCLHDHHLVHGSLHMDNVIVGSDSVARLHGHSVSIKMVQKLFVLPRTCYVSPAMAAGALPTAACDMFCYGLMCMELMARGKVWRWAVSDQGEPGGTDDELAALMAAAEQPFFDAVAAGRIVVNTALLDGLSPTNQTEADAHAAVRACVSYKPRQRPTPQDMLAGVESLLAQCWPDDFRWRRKSKTAKAVCGL